MKKRLIAAQVLVIFIYLVQTSSANSEIYFRYEAPEFVGKTVVSADLLDIGRPQLLIGGNGWVDIMLDDEVVETVSGFPGNVTSLAIGDLNGNFRPELIIGTDNAGAFYIYEKRQGRWERAAQPNYLWSPISYLQVIDINGDGWGDILVLTQAGEARIYLSWQGELYNFWRSKPEETVSFVYGANLTGNNQDEVVFSYRTGYVGVLSWQENQLNLIWENFPWGQIDGLAVGKVDNDALPRIMVMTSQKMFYSWGWNGERFGVISQFFDSRLGDTLIFDESYGLFSFSKQDGLSLFKVRNSSLEELWRIENVNGVDLLVHHDILIRTKDNQYYWLREVENFYLSVSYNNQPLESVCAFRVVEDDIMVCLDDLADLLDLTIHYFYYDHDKFIVSFDSEQLTVFTDKAVIQWRDIFFPISQAALRDNEKFYVSLDFFEFFGWKAQLNMSEQTLNIYRDWGWLSTFD